MQDVFIYTKQGCPFCVRAVALLRQKGAEFEEIDATGDAGKRQDMIKRANGRSTFPQIFIGQTHIGGCDDLLALDAKGDLDPMLQG
jgi:glutaredoxin 3